ncbi:lysostaphin resistance A-like protein [Pedobacter sp. MW01-1-1]|uniref:lysostaphin resistance A-like protein n=1 Tax=Pedobacter sp. MW01-1-1 TaxID=3383027 RepID=UPI003FF047E9
MNFVTPNEKEIDPFLQLLLLLVYATVGAMAFTLIALLISGLNFSDDFSLLMSNQPKYTSTLKLVQIFSAIGTFVLPPLALALTNRICISKFYSFAKPDSKGILLVILIMALSTPFMEALAILNQKMVLPEFLKGIEAWMKAKEEEAAKMTIQLITVRSNLDFLVNLLMIAIIPAIGEELMFRGGVQRSLNTIFKNQHVAIWLTAMLFSAIHLQFYGFIPRMLLGAGFGYLYFYGGSIWYAILAHFLNNAFAVCQVFYMQKKNIPLENADQSLAFPYYICIISAIITLALFKYFKDNVNRERKLD